MGTLLTQTPRNLSELNILGSHDSSGMVFAHSGGFKFSLDIAFIIFS